jgi:outer membrane protein OmpA-like peptidoglycan-associated protein
MRGFLLLLSITYCLPLFAQQKTIELANKFYSQGNYINAIQCYEKCNSKDFTIEIKKKIINCFRLTNQLSKSELYLSDVCNSTKDRIYCNYYLNLLIQKKDYEKIKSLSEKGIFKIDFSVLKNKIQALYNDTAIYKISALKINSEFADMGMVKYKNGFVFCSSRPINSVVERKHTWTNQAFLKLFYCENINENWSEPMLFNTDIKSKYNIGPLCFSNKGKELWVTENYSTKEHLSSEKKYKLKIVHYKLIDSKWTKQKDFIFNNSNYNVAHPAVSEDGNTIYFSSDKSGGYGAMDIYVSHKTKKGWGTPVNLGEQINTIGNEVFPTLLSDGTIYFSSDGLIGLGGLDLYISKNINDNFLAPVNIGAPLNSAADDFNLINDVKNGCSYLSSNRIKLGLNDDIFKFIKSESKETLQLKSDTLTNEPKVDVSTKRKITIVEKSENTSIIGVKILDDKNNVISMSDSNGIIFIDSSYNKIKLSKDGYSAKEIIFNEFKNDNKFELKKNEGLANSSWYKIIYYDLDKSDIRKDMIKEMNEAVEFLLSNPELKITITSFTDSRASANYNEKLSQRRTTSIEQFLVLHGIPKKQIVKSAWMGEGILINNCGDNLPCSEDMHQLNRRTEVFVSGIVK